MANGKLTEQELVKVLEKWTNKVVKLTSNYQTGIQSLAKAQTELEESRKKPLYKYWWVAVTLAVVVGFGVLLVIFSNSKACEASVSFKDFSFGVRKNSGCKE